MHTTLLISVMIALPSVWLLQNKSPQSNRQRTPVELWCGGDDSLTQRVCGAAYKALGASRDFNPVDVEEKETGTLVVTITENVGWKEIGTRTQVFYKVDFTMVDKKLGAMKGSCWDDDIAVCGAQILKRATIMARKINPKR